jgi:hypothetical protein
LRLWLRSGPNSNVFEPLGLRISEDGTIFP